MNPELKELLVGVLLFAAILFALALGIGAISRNECESIGERMGYKTDWGYFRPCMIKTPNGWRLPEQLRQVEQQR